MFKIILLAKKKFTYFTLTLTHAIIGSTASPSEEKTGQEKSVSFSLAFLKTFFFPPDGRWEEAMPSQGHSPVARRPYT